MKALLITAISGACFLVGALLAYFGKNKKWLIDFSIGMAFSVMLMLLAFDVVPEVIELLGDNKIFMYVFIVIGIVMLKLIDMLVPHHDHDEEVKHHERHLKHIGLISSLALIIHNIIEGMAVYNLAVHDYKTGILMAIGVGLHNIPFGIEITATLNKTKKSSLNVIFNILLLTISTILGGLIMMVFKSVNEFTLGCLMSLTVGMIIYLILFELLVEIGSSKERKFSGLGLLAGFVIMIINMVIGG